VTAPTLKKVEQEYFDLIILDVMLPELMASAFAKVFACSVPKCPS
jgi:DNA-binding response OmpR family regulator